MLPVLFTVFGFPVGSYGLSKAVAALVAGLVLARAFQTTRRRRAVPVPAVLWGFLGAKLYYLAEHASSLTWYDFAARDSPGTVG